MTHLSLYQQHHTRNCLLFHLDHCPTFPGSPLQMEPAQIIIPVRSLPAYDAVPFAKCRKDKDYKNPRHISDRSQDEWHHLFGGGILLPIRIRILLAEIQLTNYISYSKDTAGANRQFINTHTEEGLGQAGIRTKLATDAYPCSTLVTILNRHLNFL